MGWLIYIVFLMWLCKCCVYMYMFKCGGILVFEVLYVIVFLYQKIGILDLVLICKVMGVLKVDVNNDIVFYDEGDNVDEIVVFCEQLLVMYMCYNVQLIYGYFLFLEQVWKYFGKDYSYIIILCDLVKCIILNYCFDKWIGYFFGDFDEYLESDYGCCQVLYKLCYFSGMVMVCFDQEVQVMVLVKQNMVCFVLIGFMEDMDGFVCDFGKIFGVKLWIVYYNGVGKQDVLLQMIESQWCWFEQFCVFDIEFFEYF